jgi:hypothetical protein
LSAWTASPEVADAGAKGNPRLAFGPEERHRPVQPLDGRLCAQLLWRHVQGVHQGVDGRTTVALLRGLRDGPPVVTWVYCGGLRDDGSASSRVCNHLLDDPGEERFIPNLLADCGELAHVVLCGPTGDTAPSRPLPAGQRLADAILLRPLLAFPHRGRNGVPERVAFARLHLEGPAIYHGLVVPLEELALTKEGRDEPLRLRVVLHLWQLDELGAQVLPPRRPLRELGRYPRHVL